MHLTPRPGCLAPALLLIVSLPGCLGFSLSLGGKHEHVTKCERDESLENRINTLEARILTLEHELQQREPPPSASPEARLTPQTAAP